MVAAALNQGEKMSSERKASQDKSLLEKNKSVVFALSGERAFGQSWDPSSPEKHKALDGAYSASSSPLSARSSSLTGSLGGSALGRDATKISKASAAELGSPFAQSPSSSLDLSSSSYKSSLSSSTYGSSHERDCEADRERGVEKEVSNRETGVRGAREKHVVREEETAVKSVTSKSSAMNGHSLGVSSSSKALDGSRVDTVRDDHSEEAKRQSGKDSESGLGKEKDRGKQNLRELGRESDRESGKLSLSRASAGSDSNESSCSSIGYGGSKPHKANDKRWV